MDSHSASDPTEVFQQALPGIQANDVPDLRQMSYVVALTVRDGQIARHRDYWNPLALAAGGSGR